jgi:hypothetical protein
MDKYKITFVRIDDKNKDGIELRTKKNEKMWKVAIKTEQTGEDYYSALCFLQDAPEMKIQVGDELPLIMTIENGFKNFKLPSRLDSLEARVNALEARN